MGTYPCRQRAARFTAGVLLALQIPFIASALDHSASAESGHRPATAMILSPPITTGPARTHRSTVLTEYGILATPALEAPRLHLRTRTVPAGTPPEQAAPPPPEAPLQGPGESRAEGSAQALPPRLDALTEQAPATSDKATKAQPARPRQAQRRQPVRLQQADAKQQLRKAGLTWTSSGKCANRQGPHCTSLEAVRAATVSSAIALKRSSGCPLVVTGGTEVGHAPGPYSHYAGYKLDIKPNRCIDRYITKNYPLQGVRGDRAHLYGESATSGTLYAREADHWDILFR